MFPWQVFFLSPSCYSLAWLCSRVLLPSLVDSSATHAGCQSPVPTSGSGGFRVIHIFCVCYPFEFHGGNSVGSLLPVLGYLHHKAICVMNSQELCYFSALSCLRCLACDLYIPLYVKAISSAACTAGELLYFRKSICPLDMTL